MLVLIYKNNLDHLLIICLPPIMMQLLYIISEIFKQIDLNCLKFAAKDRLFQLLLLFSQLFFVLLQSDCICLTAVVTVRRVLSR